MNLAISKQGINLKIVVIIAMALLSTIFMVSYFVSQSSTTTIEILHSKGGKQNIWDDELSHLEDFDLIEMLRQARKAKNKKLVKRIEKELKRRKQRNKQKRQ